MPFQCDVPARPTLQQDDDAIRITRWDFEPGAVTGWHEHDVMNGSNHPIAFVEIEVKRPELLETAPA